MFEHQDPVVAPEAAEPVSAPVETNGHTPVADSVVPTAEAASPETNGVPAEVHQRQSQAGRKGARRVHQLIQQGRLYEQEHGLKRGRQRLRQLLELGKMYEKEHGLRPGQGRKHGNRLSRMAREELLTTLLHCLVRIAKPSFRAELVRLVEALAKGPNDCAA